MTLNNTDWQQKAMQNIREAQKRLDEARKSAQQQQEQQKQTK